MTPLQKLYGLRITLGIIAALACIGYLAATGSISKNLILNPSVEAAETVAGTPDYWFKSGNGTEWSTTYAKTGSRSLRINVANASSEWRSKATTVQEGETYQVQTFIRGTVTKDKFSLNITWFSDSAGLNRLSENNITISIGNSTQWLPLGAVFAAPSRAKSCEVLFKAVNASGDLYADNFEVRPTESITKFMNSLSVALIIYLVSYYVIKSKFVLEKEKPQKLFTTGIGIYFIAWLVFWVLLYTVIAGL